MKEREEELNDDDFFFRLKNLVYFFNNNEVVPIFKPYLNKLRSKFIREPSDNRINIYQLDDKMYKKELAALTNNNNMRKCIIFGYQVPFVNKKLANPSIHDLKKSRFVLICHDD